MEDNFNIKAMTADLNAFIIRYGEDRAQHVFGMPAARLRHLIDDPDNVSSTAYKKLVAGSKRMAGYMGTNQAQKKVRPGPWLKREAK